MCDREQPDPKLLFPAESSQSSLQSNVTMDGMTMLLEKTLSARIDPLTHAVLGLGSDLSSFKSLVDTQLTAVQGQTGEGCDGRVGPGGGAGG